MRRAVCAAVAVALVLSLGCRPGVTVEKTVHLDPTEIPGAITVDGPPYEQPVTVTVSSPVEVDVYLVLEKDRQTAEDAIVKGKKPAAVLDGKEKVTEATLTGTVPRKADYSVIFGNPAKAGEAKVKIVGK
jgi:hypothetical protein